jgi:hypothetical protein
MKRHPKNNLGLILFIYYVALHLLEYTTVLYCKNIDFTASRCLIVYIGNKLADAHGFICADEM